MKYYEAVCIDIRLGGEDGDEFVGYTGFSKEEAIKDAKTQWGRLSSYDKKHCRTEAREYDLPEGLDISDSEAVTDAICEVSGYDSCIGFSL